MKNLELSQLENISGGNVWNTTGKYIVYVCAVISAGVLALMYPALSNLFSNKVDSIV